MTAMEFFHQIEEVERSIATAANKAELFQSVAERITAVMDGEPVSHTRNVTAREDAIIRMIEVKEDLERLSGAYARMVSEVLSTMTGMDDPEEEKLLSYHHLRHLPLEEASRQLGHSKVWGYRHYETAMRNLDLLLS